jgi:NAD-dependent dihydropyrimidine dehydrogenase PreA subunit
LKKWYHLLSKKQKIQLGLVLVSIGIIILTGFLFQPEAGKIEISRFTTEDSISRIAPKLGVTGKALARDLKLNLEVSKKVPLKKLGVDPDRLRHALEHLASHRDTTLKYYLYFALCIGALFYLLMLGRPFSSDIKMRTNWYPRFPFIMILMISVIISGFWLGKSPNPMEGLVKVFKSVVGLYPDVWVKVLALAFFLLLVVVGNKIICGWACPFGALQELIYSLPFLKKIKRKKLPFWFANSIRGGLFVLMILFLFGFIGGKKGFVIYHHINPFNLFNMDFEPFGVVLMLTVALVLGFGLYRPFCQLVCPFGFVSWLFEKISLNRIRVNHQKCTRCGACIQACPNHAAKGLVDQKKLAADCFSCMRCLNKCPVDAIAYQSIF